MSNNLKLLWISVFDRLHFNPKEKCFGFEKITNWDVSNFSVFKLLRIRYESDKHVQTLSVTISIFSNMINEFVTILSSVNAVLDVDIKNNDLSLVNEQTTRNASFVYTQNVVLK